MLHKILGALEKKSEIFMVEKFHNSKKLLSCRSKELNLQNKTN